MDPQHLHSIREFELHRVLRDFPSTSRNGRPVRILDIGAGTGYQAALIEQLGYEVIAIDVPGSAYVKERVYPIIEYDGHTLPFDTGSIDVVFSSNVLEHVEPIDTLLCEIRRVLSPEGKSIHILPTSAWRMWTFLSHFVWVGKRVFAILPKGAFGDRIACEKAIFSTYSKTLRLMVCQVWPRRHGERGNALNEIRLFSAESWRRTFIATGLELKNEYSIGLFYTGNMIFADWLPLARRISMAKWLGSASHAYILEPKTPDKNENRKGDKWPMTREHKP
jgi:SAM-dependent methyltransferase